MNASPDFVLPESVGTVAEALASAGHDAVLVGGVVRDAVLGLPMGEDFDLVSTASPDVVRAACAGVLEVKSVYALGERFGTVGIALEGGGRIEVTRYREDARSERTVAGRFALDAQRRDFTANAIGYDLGSRALLDPVSGIADLENGVLRACGSASERLSEDPIRVLRAGRFAAALCLTLDPDLLAALPAHAPGLARVAPERIREEFGKLLVGRCAPGALRLMLDAGALAAILPEVAALAGLAQPSFHDLDAFDHTAQAVGLIPASLTLRWAALLHDVGKVPAATAEDGGRIRFLGHARAGAELTQSICERLRMSKRDALAITHLVAEHMRLGQTNCSNPRSVDRAIRKLDLSVGSGETVRLLASAEEALELAVADLGATAHRAEAPAFRAHLEVALARARERVSASPVSSPLSGSELMRSLGLERGPAVGVAKTAVERAVESGRVGADDREGALEVARRALDEYHRGSHPSRIDRKEQP